MRGSASTICLAAAWLVLAASKAFAPVQLSQYLSEFGPAVASVAPALAWAVVVGEALLGVMLLFGSRHGMRTVLGVVSAAAALTFVVVTLVDSGGSTPCGCFGALAKATTGRRLIVAGALLFFSIGAVREGLAE